MSYYNFPAGSGGQIETNPETGEKFIYDSDVGAWLPYRGDVDEFVNVTGDSMTGDLHLPNVDVDDTVFINEGELNADSAAVGGLEPDDFLMTPVGSTNTPYSVSTSPNGQYVLYQSWEHLSMLSSDGGETFVKFASKPGNRQGAGAVDDSGKVYLGYSSYIYSSVDAGQTWQRVSPSGGGNIVSIHIPSYNQDIVIGYTYNRDFLVSQDGGSTWAEKFRSDDIFGETANQPKNYVDHDGVTYFYGTYGHVATTSDGLNWTDISSTYGGGTIKDEVGTTGPLSLRRTGGKWVIIGYHNNNATDYEARVWVGGSNIADPFVQATGTNAPRKEGGGLPKESHVFGDGIILFGYDDRYFISEDLGESWGQEPLFTLTQGNASNYNVRAASNNKYLFAITAGANAPTSPILRSPIPNGDEQYLYWNGEVLATVQQVKDGFEGLVDLIQNGESNQSSVLEGYVKRDGDSMEGYLSVLDPINEEHAVNARYLKTVSDKLDDEIDNKVDRAGDSMDGPLILHRQPQEAMEAAPKQYVDQKVFDALNGADSALDSAELRNLFVAVEGDSMSGALFAPKFQVGPDGDNENKAIYYFDPDGDAVHELEAREATGAGVDMGAWITYPSIDDDVMWRSVAYGNGKYVATSSTGEIMYSTDAINWNPATRPASPATSNFWYRVAYGDGKFVAVAYTGTNRVMYSEDGINWTAVNVGTAEVMNWYGIAYGNGVWVAVATNHEGSNSSTPRAMYSTDAINWTLTLPLDNLTSWKTVIYADGKFVAVGIPNAGQWEVMHSEDGINWTGARTKDGSGVEFYSVAYGNGIWVAVGRQGTNRFMYSSDAINWTKISAGDRYTYWYDITYGAGYFVAVTSSKNSYNAIAHSEDGINWVVNTPFKNDGGFMSITHGGDKFVAVAGSAPVRVAVLDAPEGRSGLFYDDELIATEVNLQPLFDKVNHLSQEIGGTGDLDSEGLRGYLDDNFVSRAGDSMTGALRLPGDPTAPLHAATKQYVDAAVNNLTFDSNTIDDLIAEVIDSDDLVHVAGDTMTGFLTLHDHPVDDFHAATKAYVHQVLVDAVDSSGGGISVDSGMLMDTFVLSAGDTMTGQLVAPSFKTGPDAGNDGRSILYMQKDSVHELEVKENLPALDPDNGWIGYPSAGESNKWRDVAYADGMFVAVSPIGSANRIMYSHNGTEWHLGVFDDTVNAYAEWQSVAYGNGYWVALAGSGISGSKVMTSSDGINWRSGNDLLQSSASSGWRCIVYNEWNSLFLGISYDNSNNHVVETLNVIDGNVFAQGGVYNLPGGTYKSLAVNPYNGEILLPMELTAAPQSNPGSSVVILTPGDSFPDDVSKHSRRIVNTDPASWVKIRFVNDSFVMLSRSGTNRFAISKNGGVSWTYSNIAWTSNEPTSFAYGAGLYVVVSRSGTNRIAYSSDGQNWSETAVGGTPGSGLDGNRWMAITYGGGKFVATAESGTNRIVTLSGGSSSRSAEERAGLYFDGELIATEVNLQPLFDKVNDLSQGGGVVTDSDLAALELDDLNDVYVPSPNVGDTLVWNGTTWEAQAPAAGGGASVAYQDLAPADPENGDLWFNTSTLKLSVYHGNAWVQIGA